VVRVAQTGPPALFAFPLPLLTHTSWQTEFGRWFKSGLRNHKCAFNKCPISRNHPILYFSRLLLHKSAQTRLSAVIRCRRHSSHLARIPKAGSRRQTESPRTTEISLQVDYFRVARNPSRIDAERGDRFLQADLSLLIGSTWITSGLPTIRPEHGFASHDPVCRPRPAHSPN
jgi:hypothetical protein